MTNGVAATKELPRIFRGEPTPVTSLNRRTRREYRLSTEDTVIEVLGDQRLVEEAVAYARKKKLVGFDLETGDKNSGDPRDALDPWRGEIVLCQVGDEDRQYVIWWQTIDPTPLLELLADQSVVKAGVNLKFDLRWFLAQYGYTARAWNVVDAMLIEQILGCGMFSEDDDAVGATLKLTGMGPMAKRWLGLELPKDDAELRQGWSQMTPGQWWRWETNEAGQAVKKNLLAKKFYAADDVVIPLQIIKRQKPWIKRLGLVETVNLEHSFLPVLAEMEVRGLRVDMEKWDALASEALSLARRARRDLDQIFDVTVTIEIDEDGNAIRTRDKKYTSTQQLKDLIRNFMRDQEGVDVILSNKHLKDSLRAKGMPEERIEKLFQDAQTTLENLQKGKPGKQKKIGGPTSSDLVTSVWAKVAHKLDDGAFYVLNTESKTFKLYKYIYQTDNAEVDEELPTCIGLPPRLVDPILDLRRNTKAAGTYGYNWHNLLNEVTQRIHCNFIQAALTTGRLSSTPNFQNLPSDARYRSCFVPAEGYKYVGADWSQIEPRIIAHYSQDPTYMRVFWSDRLGSDGAKQWAGDVEEKLDLYTEVGKLIGVIPKHFTLLEVKGSEKLGIEPLPEGEKGRKQAKIIVLGLGYGTGVGKFWLMLIVDTKTHHAKTYAAFLHSTFWDSVPQVKKTLDQFSDLAYPGEEVKKWGKVQRKKSPRRIWHPFTERDITWSQTLGGRKRFYRPDSYKWWTTGRNHPIQGSGADILKKTCVILARWAWANNIDGGIVNMIHDEILFEAREHQAEAVRAKMSELMTSVGESYCPTVPITADAGVYTHWKKG